MKVDAVLILAAGKGTRMGEIGESLPKVLWPIFGRSILELEIEYAKQYNANQIFVNSYYFNTELSNYFRNKKLDAQLVLETEALDIGGAIHNVAQRLNYSGNLLIINSDQFIMLSEDQRKDFLSCAVESSGSLMVKKVERHKGYNQIAVNRGFFDRVILNQDTQQERFFTYTGQALIKLESLKRQSGYSRFFDSVAPEGECSYRVFDTTDLEYWDFGTLERYQDSIKRLIQTQGQFKSFLLDQQLNIPESISDELHLGEGIVLRPEGVTRC